METNDYLQQLKHIWQKIYYSDRTRRVVIEGFQESKSALFAFAVMKTKIKLSLENKTLLELSLVFCYNLQEI